VSEGGEIRPRRKSLSADRGVTGSASRTIPGPSLDAIEALTVMVVRVSWEASWRRCVVSALYLDRDPSTGNILDRSRTPLVVRLALGVRRFRTVTAVRLVLRITYSIAAAEQVPSVKQWTHTSPHQNRRFAPSPLLAGFSEKRKTITLPQFS
jgi:hypothetical protein